MTAAVAVVESEDKPSFSKSVKVECRIMPENVLKIKK